MIVGMLRTPYFIVMSSFCSTSHLPITTLPSNSAASSSTMGDIMRQGPHHSAQKSITTGCPDWSSSWKFSLLIANAITVSVFLLKYLYRFYAMEYLISFSSR